MTTDPNVGSGPSAAGSPKRRGKARKIVLVVLGLLVVVIVGLVLAAPTIASSIAPGKIEAAANERIKGKVKVGGLSIGWFSPTTIGPVEIIDPEGKTAARATIVMPATLWRVVSERWWSATKLDVGEVNVSGALDLIRDSSTGVTNLQRALEPRAAAKPSPSAPAPASGGGNGGGLESVKAAVKITQFDAVVRDRDAAGKLSAEQGVKDLKGTVNLDYAAKPMSIAAATDLSATPVGGGAAGAGGGAIDPVKIKLDSSVSTKAAGGLDAFKVKGDVAGAPMGLIDALAGQGGALVQGIGTRADVHVDASGTAQAATAKFSLLSAGAKANVDVALKDGVLSAAQPAQGAAAGGAGASNTISLKSTEFLASMPALRAALAKAGEQVKLDGAPGIEITIENLRVPLPPEALSGGDAKGALAKADLRGSGMDLKVHVDKMSGKVAIDQPQPGAGGAGSTAGGANGSWKSFAVDPVDITLSAADLSKPVTITGGTRATIDNAPAGDLSVRATGAGLLDQAGRLRALGSTGGGGGMADDVDADVRVRGMSTALIAPIVAGMGMPVDLRQDVGPTLDLGVQAKADVKGVKPGDAGLPPIDFTVNVASSNVKVDGTGRYAAGVVSVTGNGVAMSVNSGAALAQRIMAKPGQPSALEISGAGAVQIKVTEFSAPVSKLSGADALAAMKGEMSVEVSSLGVKPAGLSAEQPVLVQKMNVGVRLDGSSPPRVDLSSSLSHTGAPFEMTGQLTLDGITGGKLPASGAGAAQIVAFKPSGKVEIKNAPRSLANLIPGAGLAGTEPTGPGNAVSPLAAAVRESIGKSVSLTLTTQPDVGGAAQGASIKLASAAGGLGADVAATLTDKAITIGTLSAFASMDPKVVNPVLAAANANTPPGNTAPGVAGAPGVQPPIQLAQPFKLSVVSGGTITVPLKPGTFSPDFAGASDAAMKLSTDNDIAIDNVPTGADSSGAQRTTSVLVRSLACDVKAPLSGLASTQDATKRLSATFSAKAMRGDRAVSGDGMIADISGSASATMQGASPDATVKIASIDCAVVENLLGQPGLLTGGLGDKAEADVRVQPGAGGGGGSATMISATITAPKVSDAKIDLAMSADRMAITKPSTITWRPDPAFLNTMVFPPTPGAQGKPATPSLISVTQAAPVTITINKLSVATTQFKDGQITVGPLKPGVFDLDASIAAPSMAMTAMSQGAPPTPIAFEGLKVAVRKQQAAAPVASGSKGAGGAAPAAPAAGGEILATLSIDKVTTTAAAPAATSKGKNAPAPSVPAPAAAGKSSTINAHITNLADGLGVIDQKKAIVNLDMDVAAFPTPILDQLAKQKGVLVELLGPTLDAQAQARNVSLGAGQGALPTGSIQLKASSPRATAELNGNVANGAFAQTGPVTVRITQVTHNLIQMLAGAVPLVDSVEKTPPDEPAKLDGTKLTIPLDGNMAKLSGDAQISPGVARFTTKSIFSDLIGALGGKSSGSVGERIAPFKVHADKGVLTYDQFTLPVGQFSVQTKGTVDLVRRQIDIVTYAPIGSLTTKALGQLDTGIAGKLGVFDKATMVPITTKGPLDNPKTELDLGLFVKEQAATLTKAPQKVIGNLLDDLLNKKKGK